MALCCGCDVLADRRPPGWSLQARTEDLMMEFMMNAIMGDKRATFTHKIKGRKSIERFYSPRRKVVLVRGQSCSVFYWSNLNIEDTLARLRRNQNPDDGPVWEVPDDIDDDYLAQMEGEHRIRKGGKWIWEQIGSRPQHLLDCESMQVTAATMLKIIGREASRQEPAEDEESAQL